MKNLFVGNVSFSTVEGDLRAEFERFGEVKSCKIMTDRDSGRSRGFGFVEMNDDEEADRAMDSLNGKDVDGREISVTLARPKQARSDSRR